MGQTFLMRYILLIFSTIILVSMSMYLIGRVSLDFSLGFSFFEANMSLFHDFNGACFFILFLLLFIVFVFSFYFNRILKYSFSEIVGILGIAGSLLSFSIVQYYPFFIRLLVISGLLCLYSFLIPLLTMLLNKMSKNKWEKGVVYTITVSILLYWLGYKSNMTINEIFSLDSKYFVYTKFVVYLVVLSPYIFILSFLFLLLFAFQIIKNNTDKGKNTFILSNGVLSFMILFILCAELWQNGNQIIEKVALVVDFNSKSICSNVAKDSKVIYLGNKYDSVLVYSASDKLVPSYKRMDCNL